MLNARERNHYAHKLEEASVTLRAVEPCIEHMLKVRARTPNSKDLASLLTKIRAIREKILALRDDVVYCNDLLETIDDA